MGGYQHLYLERLPLVLSPSPSPNPLPTDCCAHSLFVLLPIVYIADDTQDANVMENVDTGEQGKYPSFRPDTSLWIQLR